MLTTMELLEVTLNKDKVIFNKRCIEYLIEFNFSLCDICEKTLNKNKYFYSINENKKYCLLFNPNSNGYFCYFCSDCFTLLVNDYDQFMIRFNLGLL